MSAPIPVEEIRQRMARVRRDMHTNVDELVENAKTLTDWRHYVRSKPWLAAGVAAAVGYFAVPSKLHVATPDPDTLAKLAKDNRLVVEHKPEAAARSGVTQSMFTMMSNMVMRAAMAYAGQQIGKVFGQQAAETNPKQEAAS